nr:hypothetical protein [Planctomycetota bacterium]
CMGKSPKDRYRSLLTLERDLSQIAGLGEPEADTIRLGSWILLMLALLACAALLYLVHEQLFAMASDWWNGTGAARPAVAPGGAAPPRIR